MDAVGGLPWPELPSLGVDLPKFDDVSWVPAEWFFLIAPAGCYHYPLADATNRPIVSVKPKAPTKPPAKALIEAKVKAPTKAPTRAPAKAKKKRRVADKQRLEANRLSAARYRAKLKRVAQEATDTDFTLIKLVPDHVMSMKAAAFNRWDNKSRITEKLTEGGKALLYIKRRTRQAAISTNERRRRRLK